MRRRPPPPLACGVVIKYLGSKRRLVAVLGDLLERAGARTAADLFTGTTRVAQEFKRRGATVWANDSARFAHALAACHVTTDARDVDPRELTAALAALNARPGRNGYFTETFCRRARYLQPANGMRVDAIRDALDDEWATSSLRPVLLASLLEAADRVDSTTGVQMAYLKQWAPRSHRDLELRAPVLHPGPGHALLGDALHAARSLPAVDLAYLDPPYNQHSYRANYHMWETLVAWDSPAHYGVACKRGDCRDPALRSPYNSRPRIAGALADLLAAVDARLVVLSGSDEGWLGREELSEMCSVRGEVAVLAFDSARYVGARIGIHDPKGQRVGQPGRLRNVEYLFVSGEPAAVRHAVAGPGLAAPRTPARRAA